MYLKFAVRHKWTRALLVLVSSPDPATKREKGLVYIDGFPWARYWILTRQSDSCHVAHYVIPTIAAVNVLPYLNDALSWLSHDMLFPVRPKKRSMYTRSFSLLGKGSGNKTGALPATEFKTHKFPPKRRLSKSNSDVSAKDHPLENFYTLTSERN